jgi:bleomycin hydrolase
MMAKYGLDEMEFSQNYCFFYDQLEKANLFLQGIIDTLEKPMDDKMVEWLFRNPISDGGQFTGISDVIGKYGVVPSSVMPETYSSENTSQIARLVGLKLREFGLQLRDEAAKGVKVSALEAKKTEMLSTVYRMLALAFGEPVERFTWTMNGETKISSSSAMIRRRTKSSSANSR